MTVLQQAPPEQYRLTACARCGEPAEPGQLVCVQCGNRISLKREHAGDRRRFERPPAIALLLSVIVIGAAAFGFAVSELTSDSDGGSSQVGSSQVGSSQGGSSAADRLQPAAPEATNGAPQTGTDTGAVQQPAHGLLMEWPKGASAYTVVLVTSGDRPAATRVAREAAKSGLVAGLLRSDDYDLGTGYWIVFAGRFDTQDSAEKQAGNLADRYPGAYATRVKPAG